MLISGILTMSKTIQQILDEERSKSPMKDFTVTQILQKENMYVQNLDETRRANIAKSNAKKAADPEWRAKVKKANNSWSQERRDAYNNRDKSYLNDPEYRARKVESNKKSRIPVQVKKPGEDWVEYDSVRKFAATTNDAKMFEGNPRYYFPKDMSVKTIKKTNSLYCGWEFQRLKEKQW